MQPHSGAAITLIAHLWPNLHLTGEDFIHRQFIVYTQYYRHAKFHSLLIDRINPRGEEIELQIGKDWPCHLKARFNPARQQVEFTEHSHTNTKEEWRLYSQRLEGDYYSEPIRGFSTRHVINADYIVSDRTQVRFADAYEGDADDPRCKYNFQYECKIIARY